MAAPVRWGIIGTGAIATKFAAALASLPDAKLIAIGSRTKEKAEEFGKEHNVAHRHGSYDALVNDQDVDAVYVATPHPAHKENALAALAAGKPVLLEKPFTINAKEAETVIAAARSKKLLLIEAMWTRWLPLYVKLRELLTQRIIGDVRFLRADFGFNARRDSNPRLFEPALGGGALLDIGVYPISLASMIFGSPSQATGFAQLGASGVDEHCAIMLAHPHGQLAALWSSIRLNTAQEAELIGTSGRIEIHSPAWRATEMTLMRDGTEPQLLKFPFEGNGYQFEAIEFMNCLRSGKLESAVMPLKESLSIMKTLDTLRARWGVKYPME
jgi:predicted dehydrogenase